MDSELLANYMRRFPMKRLDSGVIRTCPVRLRWPFLVNPREPKAKEGQKKGTPRFEVTLLFPLGADLTLLNKAVEAAVIEKHGPNAMALVRAEMIDWPLKDQGKRLDVKTGKPWEGMIPGAKLCAAKSPVQPSFRDRNLQAAPASAFYAGCWALATVHAYAHEFRDETGTFKKFGNVGLNNLQFLADDDRLGGFGGTNADEEFEAIDGTAPTGFEGAGAPVKDAYDFG